MYSQASSVSLMTGFGCVGRATTSPVDWYRCQMFWHVRTVAVVGPARRRRDLLPRLPPPAGKLAGVRRPHTTDTQINYFLRAVYGS